MTLPPSENSRFTHCPVPPTYRQAAWMATRHGNFQRRSGDTGVAAPDACPFDCRYLVPHVMDPYEAMDLNSRDTCYSQEDTPLNCVDFGAQGPLEYCVPLDKSGLRNLEDVDSLRVLDTRIVFLPQCRVYSVTHSTVQLTVQEQTWKAILSSLMIPPNVVELLHDNNGGVWQHVSECGDNEKVHGDGSGHTGPCAYHLCFKTSQYELMYARHDSHSKRNLVLIMGVDLQPEKQRLISQLGALPKIHLFHILFAVLATWLQKLEQSRWSLDFEVLQLEQNTGFRQFFQNIQPTQQGQLSSLRNSTASAEGWIRSIARHYTCAGEHLGVLRRELARFQALQGCHDESLEQQLADAVAHCESQQRSQAIQAHDLSWRIATQWSVLVALMSKHDSDLMIAMAQDARSDGLLMRKSAVVSSILQPATFLGTFFSMTFFQLNDSGDVRPQKGIWVYFVLTAAFFVPDVGVLPHSQARFHGSQGGRRGSNPDIAIKAAVPRL